MAFPPLFAKRVKRILRNALGEITYKDYTYGKLIGVCTQEDLPDAPANSRRKHRDSRDSNPDRPHRKKRSRYRSKEEWGARKAFRKANRFIKTRSKRELAKIKCYKCDNFGHIAPNCKLENLKILELDKDIHDKVYSFLNTSGSEFDYDSDSGSEEEIDLPELSDNNQPDNNQHDNMNTCNTCQELLKEVTDNNLRKKIIQLDIEAVNNKGKNIAEDNTLAKPFNLDPKQGMFLGMMQIVTAHNCAFGNRKKHIVTFSYEDDFSKNDIPTKSRPCQMNAELVEFCKKEIDNLLQKGLIKPSKSPWSCTAFYVNNAAEKERGVQIQIFKEHTYKTAFNVPFGQYK
ncbi:uncharacterized protein LOC125833488 [Solanum verrucosum]|uniref:uncharacterized protein LOC125833488 n=1 Tax=Solanum verrucosum TaxID=315347 RepID=UPI0020D1A812|nr:uncharacterized protein LOC125833488 [Solanum verrucosum]